MSSPGLPNPADLSSRSHSLQIAIAFLLGCLTALAGVRLYQGRLTRPLESYPVALHLDLNSATRQQLMQLPRVGPAMADRIVSSRPFSTTEDLHRVGGIGSATMDHIKDHVTVNDVVSHSAKPATDQQVHVNSATSSELQSLPGIGPKLAQRILDERIKRPFATVEELRRVSGIGPKTLEKLRSHVVID